MEPRVQGPLPAFGAHGAVGARRARSSTTYDMARSLRFARIVLAEVVSSDGPLRAIQVKKARRQFVFGDCAAEFVRLHIGPVAQESFCVEDEDPSKVVAAVRELGLDPHANISFPKGIERALTLPIQAG